MIFLRQITYLSFMYSGHSPHIILCYFTHSQVTILSIFHPATPKVACKYFNVE